MYTLLIRGCVIDRNDRSLLFGSLTRSIVTLRHTCSASVTKCHQACREGGKFSRGPQCVGGPAVAQNY